MFRVHHGWRCATLTGLLVLLGAASSDAQTSVRQVLLLQSLDRGNLILDQFTGNFRVDLDERAGSPVNVVQVVVGPTGFVGAPEQAVVDYIQSTFADRRKPDLIVTLAGPAAVFARKYRQQLFPDTPVLFAALDEQFLSDTPLGEYETAVPSVNDFPRLIDTILQLLPETQQVFMVMGAGPFRQFWRPELDKQFQRFQDRLTFVWSDELSFADVLRRCASLPRHSAIFYFAFGTDAEGGSYADERVLADLHATANAPLFAVQSVYLGAGVVGGALTAIDELSRRTADVAIQLLNGAPASGIRVPSLPPGEPTFDWRELQRWGIPESRLPAGSVVLYRRPGLWREYRDEALTAAGVLAIQSLLIVGLLYQRRARQRAERDSRRSLTLAADANRRETMSALTSSIGHELGQPLGAMMHNAQALQLMVAANRATSETIGEILSDIQTQGLRATQIIDRHRTMLRSRQLDKQPTDVRAVITETLALVAHDLRARQVQATIDLSSSPCVIDGDPVLLQQVLVNLLMNAMDAMAETPPARRRVTITCLARDTDLDISVRDTGPGLPAEVLDTLFTPFVTTKAHGLGIGLAIVRSIVDAHGGTITGRNHPDGGATFTVTLRRTASASVADAVPWTSTASNA